MQVTFRETHTLIGYKLIVMGLAERINYKKMGGELRYSRTRPPECGIAELAGKVKLYF